MVLGAAGAAVVAAPVVAGACWTVLSELVCVAGTAEVSAGAVAGASTSVADRRIRGSSASTANRSRFCAKSGTWPVERNRLKRERKSIEFPKKRDLTLRECFSAVNSILRFLMGSPKFLEYQLISSGNNRGLKVCENARMTECEYAGIINGSHYEYAGMATCKCGELATGSKYVSM